jgi:hypothetical protein
MDDFSVWWRRGAEMTRADISEKPDKVRRLLKN